MDKLQNTAWIAVDWGTSNLRVWMMDHDGVAFASASSNKGMGSLAPQEFEAALLELIEPHLHADCVTPVICAGMVGAREGWIEAPYVATPCAPPNGNDGVAPVVNDPRISVHILPGVKQVASPDVMRGEETQIAGALSRNPDFDGILCLPGTHTKWVHISAGEIVSFKTFMTGELFALLSEQSVLRHSVTDETLDPKAFLDAVADTMSQPHAFASKLFGLRAAGLVGGAQPQHARARLSGMLVGLELGAARPYWLGQQVAILGAGPVGELYRVGLEEQGVPTAVWDVTDLTLVGLSKAYEAQKGSAA